MHLGIWPQCVEFGWLSCMYYFSGCSCVPHHNSGNGANWLAWFFLFRGASAHIATSRICSSVNETKSVNLLYEWFLHVSVGAETGINIKRNNALQFALLPLLQWLLIAIHPTLGLLLWPQTCLNVFLYVRSCCEVSCSCKHGVWM